MMEKNSPNKSVSFINQEIELKPLDMDSLLNILQQNEELKKEKKISGCDLSDIESLSNIDFSGYIFEDVVFNRFDPTRKDLKEIFNVSFKGCKMTRVSFTQCRLERCNFDAVNYTEDTRGKKPDIDLFEVDFFFTELKFCRFKNVRINTADFRYSNIEDCSLGYMNITLGDFYMTSFRGTTNFACARFELCSITNATFEHQCPSMGNIISLAQENHEQYSSKIIRHPNWKKLNPCSDMSCLNKAEERNKEKGNEAKQNNLLTEQTEQTEEQIAEEKENELVSRIFITKEAMQTYAMLSGEYNGKGLFKDSNEAYARSKNCEIEYINLLIEKYKRCNQWRKMIICYLEKADPMVSKLLGYGYRIKPLILATILLILLFLLFLILCEDKGFVYSLIRSIANMVSPNFEENDDTITRCLVAIDGAVGVLLVGFVGFVFANKIRNNS